MQVQHETPVPLDSQYLIASQRWVGRSGLRVYNGKDMYTLERERYVRNVKSISESSETVLLILFVQDDQHGGQWRSLNV